MNRFICFILIIVLFNFCKRDKFILKHLKGEVFGTYYNIKYVGNDLYEKEIKEIFVKFNNSLSTYLPTSIISKINKGEKIKIDLYFEKIFKLSKEIYKISQGAFDPTLGNLVNIWGFGPEKKKTKISFKKIKNIINQMGMNKVYLKSKKIYKPKEIYLDFNGIAKGYAVDIIGEFLESKNINHYLVEIGGEIRTKGKKSKNKPWLVGIERPFENQELGKNFIFKFPLENKSIATSGGYRKFKKNSQKQKFIHILDPKKGKPALNNLLSVSVITKECAIADGYATAFMALGLEKSKEILNKNPNLNLEVYFIYKNKKEEIKTYHHNW